ncbi:hypothetical protein HMPREF9123_0585 [Neisseria bacilliformis ATCC BAA-1200]|uniref:Uncharacterized protein n=1 Tax=Neisseria bacilliformis ATCC BAA-1200 TaxID=888742 RepID=F2B9Y6_9NEIS|nr:hypothetical protein HMPREF9123_0585 [Neisseria bacilliformis ATCC BAA-1200]
MAAVCKGVQAGADLAGEGAAGRFAFEAGVQGGGEGGAGGVAAAQGR